MGKELYRDPSPVNTGVLRGGRDLARSEELLQAPARKDLHGRVRRTLRLFEDWGHAATLQQLDASLLGGSVGPSVLSDSLAAMEGIRVHHGLISLDNGHDLIAKTERRLRSHAHLEAEYRDVARSFARDLLGLCPFVQSIALAGSLASGGFDARDDIDFDLFVEDGTKYTTYLLATLLGIKYAWRYRDREVEETHRTPLLPKITCVNVVWSEEETDPFTRQDEGLAYELLRCQPLHGARRFRQVLRDNPWIGDYFPQLYERAWASETRPEANAIGRLLRAVRRSPRAFRALEKLARSVSWVLYQFVQWSRQGNPGAWERMEFLRRVKYPYEVFQD